MEKDLGLNYKDMNTHVYARACINACTRARTQCIQEQLMTG